MLRFSLAILGLSIPCCSFELYYVLNRRSPPKEIIGVVLQIVQVYAYIVTIYIKVVNSWSYNTEGQT